MFCRFEQGWKLMYSSTYYVKELRTMISLHRILICTGFPVVSYLRVGILHMHATLLILDIVGVFNNVNHGAGRCIWIRPYFEGEDRKSTRSRKNGENDTRPDFHPRNMV